jgi:acyl carrier protein
MPLTLNGKVNYEGLPEWEGSSASRRGAKEYVAARSETERKLSEVWGEVLKVERVGIEDNFFELGGHSLLATQVVSRIRDTFRVKIALGDLFKSPTIQSFALLIEEAIVAQSDLTELTEVLNMLEGLDEDEATGLLIAPGNAE